MEAPELTFTTSNECNIFKHEQEQDRVPTPHLENLEKQARPGKPAKIGGFQQKPRKILQNLQNFFYLTLKKPKSLNRKSI